MTPLQRLQSELQVYLDKAHNPIKGSSELFSHISEMLKILGELPLPSTRTFGFPNVVALPTIRPEFLAASYYDALEKTRVTEELPTRWK